MINGSVIIKCAHCGGSTWLNAGNLGANRCTLCNRKLEHFTSKGVASFGITLQQGINHSEADAKEKI